MKVKYLIKELEKFNPDGEAEVKIIRRDGNVSEEKVAEVRDSGCAMINPVIIAFK